MSLYLLSAFVHAYVAARIVPAWLAKPWLAGLLCAWLAISVVLVPRAVRSRRSGNRRRQLVSWLGLVAMGLLSSLFVLTVVRDLLLLLLLVAGAAWPGAGPPESFQAVSGFAVPLLALAITAVGYANARRLAQVRRVAVRIDGLRRELDGFSIAQISDVHVGPTIGRAQVESIVQAVNALQPDMVAITGDLVDGTVADLRDDVAALAALRSRYGTFFVTGNHEYYSGAAAWVVELRRIGITVLMNEHVALEHASGAPSGRVVVAGVTDYITRQAAIGERSDPVAALAGAPPAGLRVLLAHQPRSALDAESAGYHLQLSGHTHGGQFWPWNHLVRLQQPYTAGLHKLGAMWVYTSRGTGYWGPPKRFAAPSEITLLRMRCA